MANCQRCGADIPVGAAKCEYCGGVVDLPKERGESAGARTSSYSGGSASENTPRFARVSVGMMVFYTLITLGLYISIWFFLRRRDLAKISHKARRVSGIFGCLLGLHIFYLLGYLGYLGNPDAELLDVVTLVGYALWGAIIYSAIVVRAALAELAASQGREADFAGSIALAVILNAFYLQSQINRMIDARLLGAAS